MKICIVSDSHDRADALACAVREAKLAGASAVIHCGDLIGTQTLRPTLAEGLPLHVIHGNNLGDPVSLSRLALAGAFVYMASPPGRLALVGLAACSDWIDGWLSR